MDPQVIGKIEIVMVADGRVASSCEVKSEEQLVMMLAAAQFQLLKVLAEKKRAGKIIPVAPVGLDVPRA